MRTVDQIMADIEVRIEMTKSVQCPHCKAQIDMTDCERYCGHTTYWGEEEPKAFDCPKCEVEIYIKEHVTRYWTSGRTPEEAEEA